MAASATFALKAGVWFRRGRLLIVSPDSLGTACSLSGRNSTYRPVQISGTGSVRVSDRVDLSIGPGYADAEQVARHPGQGRINVRILSVGVGLEALVRLRHQ